MPFEGEGDKGYEGDVAGNGLFEYDGIRGSEHGSRMSCRGPCDACKY